MNKARGAKSGGNHWQLLGVLSQWRCLERCLILLKWCVTKYVKRCQPGKLTRALMTRDFCRDMSYRQPHDWPQLLRLQHSQLTVTQNDSKLHEYKSILIVQNMLRAQRSSPRSQAKGQSGSQDFLWSVQGLKSSSLIS